MPWVNGKYFYTKKSIDDTIGTLRWKCWKRGYIGDTDAEVDVYLACKCLGLKYKYKNAEKIMEWLNGKR